MTLTLHLGVLEIPYTEEAPAQKKPKGKARRGKKRPKKKTGDTSAAKTTGDVAQILEGKYHIMSIFYELNEEQIAGYFADAMAGALEDVFAGAPPQAKPYAQAESDIQTRFREFLDRDEMAHTATPGVPTRAARRGVNHRLKIKKGNPRPSFIDTGAYQGAFLAWVDES